MELFEVEELLDSIQPELVNLKSFETKKGLLNKIWDKSGIKENVKLKLLEIAYLFIDTLNLGEVEPNDIIIVGSIAGFNWSKYSDIDLHIVYDFSKLDASKEIIKDYFDAKKVIWNNLHSDLKIYRFEVELYVQDCNEKNASDGVYSLLKDRWIQIPHTKDLVLNKELITLQSAKLINEADKLEKRILCCNNKLELKELNNELNNLYKSIVKGRKDGLATDGESAAGNIIFKVLRRSGHLEKLRNLKYKLFDMLYSI